MATVNHLKRPQQRKLEDHLVSTWTKIRQRKLTADKVAEEATETLGFKISPINVRSSAKTMELKWAAATKKKPITVRFRPVILSMVHVCTELCQKFDLPVPSTFDVFVSRSGKYKYEPVLKAMAGILKEIAPLADIEWPKELEEFVAVKEEE